MGTNQNVIDAITIIKNAICGDATHDGIKQIVGATTGRLSQQQKDDIAPLLTSAEGEIAKIISTTESPYLDPDDAGSGYTPQTWTGSTKDLITSACQQACDILDEYVACNDVAAGENLRHTQDALDAFKTSGGS